MRSLRKKQIFGLARKETADIAPRFSMLSDAAKRKKDTVIAVYRMNQRSPIIPRTETVWQGAQSVMAYDTYA